MGVREVFARQELTVINLPILLAVHISVTKRNFHGAKHGFSLFSADMMSWSLKAACMPTCGCSNRKRKKKENMAASVIVLRREKTINKREMKTQELWNCKNLPRQLCILQNNCLVLE